MRLHALAALPLCMLLAGCYATAASQGSTEVAAAPLLGPDEIRDLTPAEKAILTKSFAAGLKDPDSAKFQWAKVRKAMPLDGSFDYCAMVNSKNSYGGYVGMQPFIGTVAVTKGKITAGVMGAVGESTPMYRDILPKMCRDKGLDPFIASL